MTTFRLQTACRAVGITLFALVCHLPSAAGAQGRAIEGRIVVVWDLPNTRDNPDGTAVFVIAPDGQSTRLTGNPDILGQIAALDRQFASVSIAGIVEHGFPASRTARALRVLSVPFLNAPGIQSAQVTPRPFITILCRYSDDPSSPATVTEMERVTGPIYPGVAHYFAELSQDPAVMAGNRTVGWYTLPQPRSVYIRGDTIDLAALATDCTGAADADVNFADWYGVNLQLNGDLGNRTTPPFDPLSLGGSWAMARDGPMKVYGMTWMGGSFRKNYVGYTHEMGHALGWPHSSGRYGQEYDSRWDVMSVGYLNFTQQFGWLTIHTIASHKDRAGWIPASRKWIAQPGTSESRVISRTALPADNGDMLMAEIPISGTSVYTVESRRIAGYDAPLPGEAVLLHQVDQRRAYVVDPDNNGNPNDAAAMWTPGETFQDAENQITVTVESATASGFVVRITRGGSAFTIIGDTERRAGVVGSPYADTIQTQGALGPPIWSIASGALPPGLTLATATGAISGAPSKSGTYSFSLVATAGSAGASRDLIIRVADPVAFLFSAGAIQKSAAVAAPYADTLRASGGSGTYNWTIASGSLPPGLVLGAQNGVISGAPTATGTFPFTAGVSSTFGTLLLTASRPLSMTVYPAVAIISDSVRPQAVMGAPYADTLKATGGDGEFSWKTSGGELPPGLSFDSRGIISGTPTQATQSRITITLMTNVGSFDKAFTVAVVKPSLLQEQVMDQLLGTGALSPAELRFLDLIGNKNDRFDLGDVRAWLIDRGVVKANLEPRGATRAAPSSSNAKGDSINRAVRDNRKDK